ncbi:Uncharacterised protein [Mycobacteroides abscessus subsp. abscessus]|nr:Uncharacterised protein [Mycobacteroides abscessus subsp. abscessus]
MAPIMPLAAATSSRSWAFHWPMACPTDLASKPDFSRPNHCNRAFG